MSAPVTWWNAQATSPASAGCFTGKTESEGFGLPLLLLTASALFGVVLLLNNLVKAIARRERVAFGDVLLAFLVTLPSVTALIVNSIAEIPDALVSTATAILALAIIGISLFTLLIEIFRPQRLRGSRGVLGMFAGLLMLLSSFSVPFLAVYFELSADAPGAAAGALLRPEATAEAVVEGSNDRATQLFKAIRDILSEEIDADEAAVFAQLDAGVPLARIVEANGGDVERVIDRLTTILSDSLREAADRGEVSRLQAALLLSQMEPFVRLAVNSDLNELGGRFTTGPTATGTRPSLLDLLTPSPESSPEQRTPAPATNTPRATAAHTASPTSSATPEPTQRPSATPTPSRTRFQYATRTPAPTATAVTPCIATVNFNLRLRSAPSTESETLLVIPYTTAVELTGRSADSSWWQTTYEGQTGWLDGQYLSLSAGCASLPPI